MAKKIVVALFLGALIAGQAPFALAQDTSSPTVTASPSGPPSGGGSIKIGVTDKNGSLVKARVVVKSADGKTVADGNTGASGGAVVFTTLPPGAYTAAVEAQGYAQSEQAAFKIQPGVSESLLITVTAVYSPDPTKPQTTSIPPMYVPPVPPTWVCPFEVFPMLQRGSRGDAVKQLQKMLGLPEELQTGFFGPTTESKVKEVEGQYQLPKTGVVDSDLRPIFFPCYQLLVLAPNGGETWYGGQTYEVNWAIETPYLQPMPIPMPGLLEGDRIQSQSAPKAGVKELKKGQAESSIGSMPPGLLIRPIPSYLSVDLVQYGNVVAHIGAVDIYGGTQSLSWIVPKHLQSGSYRVRVSVQGSPIYDLPAAREKSAIFPGWAGVHWDESDADFKIANDVTPPPPNPKLKEQMNQLLRLLEEMQRLVREMVAGL